MIAPRSSKPFQCPWVHPAMARVSPNGVLPSNHLWILGVMQENPHEFYHILGLADEILSVNDNECDGRSCETEHKQKSGKTVGVIEIFDSVGVCGDSEAIC